MWSQKIKTLLFPVLGLDLEPPAPSGEVRIEGNVQPSIAFLVGKGTNGSVLIEATDDGSMKVASSGAGLDTYEVFSGNAADAAAALAVSDQSARLDLVLATYSLDLAFQKSDGSWLGDIVLAPGTYSFDFSFKAVRINNTVAGSTCVYQIIAWR